MKNYGERMSRKKGVLFSYILTVVETLSSLVYTPILIRMLGQSEYGVYSLVYTITTYLTLLDLGVGNSLVRYLSKYRVLNDREKQNQFIGVSTAFYVIISALLLVLGVILNLIFPYVFAKGLSAEEIRLSRILLTLTVAITIVQFCGKSFGKALVAYEQFVLSKVVLMVQIVLRVIVCLALLFLGYKSIAVVAVNLVLTILINIFYVAYGFIKLHFRPTLRGVEKSFVKEVFSYSSIILVQMVATQINAMADQVLIGALVKSSAAILGIYAVGAQVTHYYQSFAGNMNGVLMPGVVRQVESHAPPQQLQKEMVRIGRWIFMILALIYAVFAVFGRDFICLWAGEQNAQAYLVAVIILTPMVFSLTQSIGSQILWAQGKALVQAILKIVVAVLNLALTAVLIVYWDPLLGAAVGTGVSMMLGDVVVMNIVFKKDIGISMRAYYVHLLHGVLPALGISALFGVLIKQLHFSAFGWLGLVLNCGGMCVAYAICMLWFGLNTAEKQQIRTMVGKFTNKLHRA